MELVKAIQTLSRQASPVGQPMLMIELTGGFVSMTWEPGLSAGRLAEKLRQLADGVEMTPAQKAAMVPAARPDVCLNCDCILPAGCEGTFQSSDGQACALNRRTGGICLTGSDSKIQGTILTGNEPSGLFIQHNENSRDSK